MNCKNFLPAGIWFSSVKPCIDVILKPVLGNLKDNKILVDTVNGQKLIKACLISTVFDLQAMDLACNIRQFNGYCSCLHCLNKGEHISCKHVLKPNDKHMPRTMPSLK